MFISFNPSLFSRIVKWGFIALGIKKSWQTDTPNYLRMRRRNFDSEKVRRHFGKDFELSEFDGFKVYNCNSAEKDENRPLVIWFHGGGYVVGPFKEQFDCLLKICQATGSRGMLIDYPKAPEHTYRDTFQFLDRFYVHLLAHSTHSDFYFIGDSAGGGLATSFALTLQEKKMKLPRVVFAFSPWLDFELAQPETKVYDETRDPFLSLPALRVFAKWFSGDAGVKNTLVSPIFNEPISFQFECQLYSGTLDLLHPSIVEFYQKFRPLNQKLSLTIKTEMMHAFAVMPIREGREVLEKVIAQITTARDSANSAHQD